MIEINASPGRIINIGYEGEDNVTLIKFRYDEAWLSHGAGEFKIRVKRPCDAEAYNATQIVDDREEMTLAMIVTDIELSVKGYGEMQIAYIGADFVKKSPVYRYNVSRAIDSEIVNPPQSSIINELVQSVGDLTELTTTNKDSLVEAINEVNAKEGSSVTVDDELSSVSENPVQNKVIKDRFDGLDQTVAGIGGRLATAETALEGKANTSDVNTALAGKANTADMNTALAGKASTDVATQSANGLMSAQDKAKLDNVGSVVTVSGTTPTITALSGVRYVCGEVATLDITPCASGICDIVFTSGSTATVLTLPNTVKFPDGTFTPEANTTYEINIMDGVYGAVMAWT
ncbi:MAG TPA: hypothetical protein DCG33_04540 [Prevotellaceae bacterium]|nr:hypothetical protein [Prevotellaceae bacterium]